MLQFNYIMLSVPSDKRIVSSTTKIQNKIGSPNDKFLQPIHSPMFSRKGSINKKQKLLESGKSSESKSIQKSLKYTKFLPFTPKNDISQIHSEVHVIRLLNQESQQTVQLRSKSKKQDKYVYSSRKSKDNMSSGHSFFNMSLKDTGRKEKEKGGNRDEHYIYWKNKAHQYLEVNMKLMNQVRTLTKENERLKRVISECELQLKTRSESQIEEVLCERVLSREMRSMSSVYMGKIEGMERELKKKEIMIASYELKINDLSARLTGDKERIKLIANLEEELEQLKEELNPQQHRVTLKFHSHSNESTSTFPYEYTHR